MDALEFTDVAEWRNWLAANHGSSGEVWLVYRKGAAASGSIGYGESVEEALCFGWVDGLIRRIDDERYMRRFTPRRPGAKWSVSNKERIARLVAEGRMAEAGTRVVEAARVDGSWDRIPDAEREWSMPIELRDVLDADPGLGEMFEALSPSHRKQYLRWVASAKREETRRRRATRAGVMIRSGERPG